MATGYDELDNLQTQTNQLYDEQMKQQESMINTSTQQAIDEIERNKQKAQQEADKTNRALYTDYQKQVNPYGVNAENLAEQGLAKSGLAETTKANYYNTYQTARTEAMNNANTIKADFDAEIVKARQNGDLQKAQALFNLYSQKISDLSNMYNLKFQADQFSYQKEQDALAQSNWEKEFQQALQQAQWEQAFNQSQFDYQKDRDVISDNQWNQQFDYQKAQDALSQSNWEKEYEQALKEMLWNQQFNQSQFDYQKERDKVADSQWNQEFALAKKKSSTGSSSSKSGNTINLEEPNNDKQDEKTKLMNENVEAIRKGFTEANIKNTSDQTLRENARKKIYADVQWGRINDEQADYLFDYFGL